jgi:hypothetical protein
MTLTFSTLASNLESNDLAAMAMLKTVFLRDPRPGQQDLGTFHVTNANDIAHILSVMTVIATLENEKNVLKSIRHDYRDATTRSDLTLHYAENEANNRFQSLKRDKAGEFVLDKEENIPTFELDGKKIAKLILNADSAFFAVAGIDLDALVESRAFKDATTMRVSHPTKLSAPSGVGGFLKTTSNPMPEDFLSVTEEDYLTRETDTLACSAGFQKMWALILPIVSFDGKTVRIADLLANDHALSDAVSQVFLDNNVSSGNVLVEALSGKREAKMSGEPQVFCGDLPHARRISLLAPYSMFNEVIRAKKVVTHEYEKDRDVLLEGADAAIAMAESAIDENKLQAADKTISKDKKKLLTEEKKRLNDDLRKLKANKGSLASKNLTISAFTMQFGGSTPRNIAMDMDTTLHSANVRVMIYSANPMESANSGQAFQPSSHVATPRLEKFEKIPRYLDPDATGIKLSAARREFFAEIITASLAPLMGLQESYRNRSDALINEVALGSDAQDRIEMTDAGWSIFIKGDRAINNKAAAVILEPLVTKVTSACKKSLQTAMGDGLSSFYDAELRDLAAVIIAKERA